MFRCRSRARERKSSFLSSRQPSHYQHAFSHMSTTVTVTVLYFASAREATRTESERISLATSSSSSSFATTNVSALKVALIEKHGEKLARILETAAISVDCEYTEGDEDEIRSGSEVAVIPPISGG
jgi:molybdopterin converting factor small subunit